MSACKDAAVPDSDQAVSATHSSLDGRRRYGVRGTLCEGLSADMTASLPADS